MAYTCMAMSAPPSNSFRALNHPLDSSEFLGVLLQLENGLPAKMGQENRRNVAYVVFLSAFLKTKRVIFLQPGFPSNLHLGR
jgi:hypothetical protein